MSSQDSSEDWFTPSLEAQNLMPPPPKAIYHSKQAMREAIDKWAEEHQYCLRVGQSKPIGKALDPREKIYYECDRAGPPPVENRPESDQRRPQDRVRSTGTKKTGCHFSVIGFEVRHNYWELRHRQDPLNSVHNHDPSPSALAHPRHRKLDETTIQEARKLRDSGKYYTLYIHFGCFRMLLDAFGHFRTFRTLNEAQKHPKAFKMNI